MPKPSQETRKYPAGTGEFSNDEKRREGGIRPRYDRPNQDGFKFYGAGLVRLVPELNVGLMVYPLVITEEPSHSINLDAISSGMDYANWQGTKAQILEILRQESAVHQPESVNPNYAFVIMKALRTGRDRFVMMAGNVPFRFYHQSSGERITESGLSLAHEVSLKKGDGLLVASPQVIAGVYDHINFQIRRALEVKDLDPAAHLLFAAQGRFEVQAGLNHIDPMDSDKQAIMAIRAASPPLEIVGFLRRSFFRFLHG